MCNLLTVVFVLDVFGRMIWITAKTRLSYSLSIMAEQSSIPRFDAEANVCRRMFRNDKTLYLKQIEKLYHEEIVDIRLRYDQVVADQSLSFDKRWSDLYDLRLEQALCSRLRKVIQDLLEERQKYPGSKMLHCGSIRFTADNATKTRYFQQCVAKMRSLMPEVSEEYAIEMVRLVTPEYEWC